MDEASDLGGTLVDVAVTICHWPKRWLSLSIRSPRQADCLGKTSSGPRAERAPRCAHAHMELRPKTAASPLPGPGHRKSRGLARRTRQQPRHRASNGCTSHHLDTSFSTLVLDQRSHQKPRVNQRSWGVMVSAAGSSPGRSLQVENRSLEFPQTASATDMPRSGRGVPKCAPVHIKQLGTFEVSVWSTYGSNAVPGSSTPCPQG